MLLLDPCLLRLDGLSPEGMKALRSMWRGPVFAVILFSVASHGETENTTTTDITTTAADNPNLTTTTTVTILEFVTGEMQATVSSCVTLQTDTGRGAIKTGIATLAQVTEAQVSTVDVTCPNRRLSFLPRLLSATAQIGFGIQVLGGDGASIQARMESTDNASQQLQDAIQTAGLDVNITVDSAVASLVQSLTTPTTTAMSTATTTVAGTTSSSEFPVELLIVIILLCVVLICCVLPVGGIMWRKQVQEQRVMAVRKLDDEVIQLETLFDELSTQVEVFNDKCQKELDGRYQREFRDRVGDQQQGFKQKWEALVEEKKRFLKEYEFEMLRRQPAEVSRQPSTVAQPPPTLQEKIWPPMPVTDPNVIQGQHKQLNQLDKTMKETCDIFGQQVRLAFPNGLPEIPSPGVLGSIRSEPVNASIQQEASLLAPFTHPLFAQVTVKPHGVLGAGAGVAPFTEIPAVVVDPAGWRFVGKTGEVKGAGGAAGAIYDWLGLKKTGGKFPAEVREHFSTHTEEEAETRAKFFAYNQGMHVIHVVGPKIRSIQNALHDLSRTYVNVFDEFCKVYEGPATTSRPTSQVLRLLPISSGIFLQNRKLERYMAEITWSSIVLAFGMMPTAQQEILRNSSIEVCIFKKAEFKLYEQKLKEKKNLLDSSMANKLKLTETFGAVPDKGGFDWVRTKNMPTDRLERLACFTRTAHALAAQGFTSQAGEVKLELQPTISGTEVVRASAFNGTGSGRKLLHHENLTVMEVALKTQSSGKMTMAVNAASAYQVGGGVMSGGRHALEETWCTMSTLLPSLQKVQWQDRRDTSHAPPGGHHLHQHIPVDACVLSPAIQVFRDTSAKGYRFQERPVTLTGVCSMAMFNMNSRVADSPLDAPREFTEYCKQVKDKFKAAMACMLKLKATVLVCPDVGCGVFENDPEVMGCLLGEVVLDYPGDLEVIATGKPAFFDALRKTVEADPKLPLRATGAAPASFEKLKAAPPKAAPPKAAPYAPKAKAKSAPGTSAPSGASASGPPLAEAKAVSPAAPSAPKAKAKSGAVQAKASPKAAPMS